jgi:hypothetical protein
LNDGGGGASWLLPFRDARELIRRAIRRLVELGL